ncbi:BZ3500_MvSof-1268-A1-R1_Chr5-3g08228 [Microbotryum saponariae]|uniref:BZ3500_MvSof-1268-A1-R1_Chr5-3g08228 protein n=1 Tax=Microbotryum saponariae TaxID=289078 RepID=A0A2X0KEQ6_9BASI|nr:BZ3500_MvSof-1268-A1-R1_Chr5-3g08228 [Microbotryum saponariae]SDA07987.1 BZ3501_MvSof-1269-A2-R1_Chr5-1g07372 [Microbotryum saponariae]
MLVRRWLQRPWTCCLVSPVGLTFTQARKTNKTPCIVPREILLKKGYNVVALQRSETPELVKLADTYSGSLVISKGDVAKDEDNKASLVAAVDVAMQMYSRLDGLILNAGTLSPLGKISSMTDRLAEHKALFDTNYFSLVSIISHALPFLNERANKDLQEREEISGRIVMVSSGASTGGVAGWGAYSASKAAMNSLARTLGNEEPNISTLAVRPGVVDTEMQTSLRATGEQHMSAKDFSKFTGLHERGELVPPEKPGAVLAGLAIKATKEWSGNFVSWDAEEMKEYAM